MELYTLNINVNKQRLSFGENKPEIFSGDQSIDFVEFTFEDDMWNFPDIWAIFSRQKGTSYQVSLEDNKVMIPAEVMQKRGYVYIGLMATDGENVQTSSVLQYSIGQGSTNVDAITPSASIYEQFLADLDAYQTAVSELASIEARITTAESSVANLEGRVTTAEASVDSMESDVASLQSAISTAQSNITALQTDVTNLQTSVTALESAVPTLQRDVSALQTGVTNLESRLTAVSTSVSGLEDRLATAQANMTDLEDGLTDAEGRLTTIGNQITDAQTDIEEIETAIQQNNIVTDVTAEGISLVDNHIADLSFMCVTDTASGDVASFPDGSGVAMKKAEVSLEPIQDLSHGDPSPTNICPIDGYEDVGVSVRGVNMWDEEWEEGAIVNGNNVSASCIRSKNYIPVCPSTTYYLKTAGQSMYVSQYDADKNWISPRDSYINTTFTTKSNTHFIRFNMPSAYGTTYNNDISINYPSTDHDYHVYAGTDYTTDLGRTVYGGTVDLASGRLVVDRAMTTLGALSWATSGTRFYSQSLSRTIKRGTSSEGYDNIISDLYHTDNASSLTQLTDGGISVDSGGNVQLRDDRFSSVSDLVASMSNAQLCYELETPQTYQLTPQQIQTLVGVNNVWSEDGTIEVEYIANLKDYIDKKINA